MGKKIEASKHLSVCVCLCERDRKGEIVTCVDVEGGALG